VIEFDNDLNKAHDLYLRAVILQPDDSAADERLAQVTLNTDRLEKSRKLFEYDLELKPASAANHVHSAQLYRMIGYPVDAKHEIERYQRFKDL
jgi:predicted Zn-dependent protease